MSLVKFFLLFFLILLSSISALSQEKDPPGVPKDCFFDCKEQYQLLDTFGDFTSDEAIRKAFGDPTERAKGAQYEVIRYVGSDVEFLIVNSAKDARRLAVAVFSREKASKARIPYLSLGTGFGEKLKWIFTLNDVELDFARERCENNPIGGADARYFYFWTPKCYFGRPGRYKNYSFLYYFDPACKGVKDALSEFRFQDLKCPKEKSIPMSVVVTDDENPSHLGEIVSSYLYWGDAN